MNDAKITIVFQAYRPDTQPVVMEKTDFLWKAIQRYDVYIGTTNAKAAFLIAWNTFLFGTIVVKGTELAAALDSPSHPWYQVAFWILAIVSVFTALLSLWFTFKVVNPFLKSPTEPMKYHSLIFFGDVAKYSKDDYISQVAELDEEKAIRDLAIQVHTVAIGTASKFAYLRVAIVFVIAFQIPAALLVVGVFVFKFFRP